jgi:dual specificity phosphatase 12
MQVSGAARLAANLTLQLLAPISLAQRLPDRRRALATSQYLLLHNSPSNVNDQTAQAPSAAPSQNCAHYFLDPLSWMRPELEQGKLDGRLECPKCRTNVGKYAWQGMQCSCGEWVVPGISLSKGRIDEARKANFGIRRPPGASVPPPPDGTQTTENL